MAQSPDITLYPLHNLKYKLFDGFMNAIKRHCTGPVFLAGGAARILATCDPVESALLDHDIDIFFSCPEDAANTIKYLDNLALLQDKANSASRTRDAHTKLLEYLLCTKAQGFNSHSRTLNSRSYFINIDFLRAYVVSLIDRFFASNKEELVSRFDFTICQFVIEDGVLYASKEALEDCETKTLRISKHRTHPTYISRVNKYIRYGFTPTEDLAEAVEITEKRMQKLIKNGKSASLWECKEVNDYGEIDFPFIKEATVCPKE